MVVVVMMVMVDGDGGEDERKAEEKDSPILSAGRWRRHESGRTAG